MSFHGTEIGELTPGSEAWLNTISASKVPAILGLSRWDSPFSLWAKITGRIEREQGNSATTRGTYLEPAIREWFADQHPEFDVTTSPSYAHPERDSWTSAPDGLVHHAGQVEPHALLEVKTAARSDEWGAEGTDEIPPAYLAQVAWQLFVTGAERCWVAALVSMNLKEYVVDAEDVEDSIATIRAHVERFEGYLARDEAPDFDGAEATYEAIRQVHPDIDPDGEHEARQAMADELVAAHREQNASAKRLRLAKTAALDVMGDARTLRAPSGEVVAQRQARGEGKPFLTIKEKKA